MRELGRSMQVIDASIGEVPLSIAHEPARPRFPPTFGYASNIWPRFFESILEVRLSAEQ
jgi:hypothetical protein